MTRPDLVQFAKKHRKDLHGDLRERQRCVTHVSCPGGGREEVQSSCACVPACPTAAGHGQLGAGGRLALSAGCWEGREGKMFVFLPG